MNEIRNIFHLTRITLKQDIEGRSSKDKSMNEKTCWYGAWLTGAAKTENEEVGREKRDVISKTENE